MIRTYSVRSVGSSWFLPCKVRTFCEPYDNAQRCKKWNVGSPPPLILACLETTFTFPYFLPFHCQGSHRHDVAGWSSLAPLFFTLAVVCNKIHG